jgi:hypothetical protein
MRQKTLASVAGFEGFDPDIEQEEPLDRIGQADSGTESRHVQLSDAQRLAWMGVKLCNSLLHRWFNLCEVGLEEVFYALLMPRFFAEAELIPATASQETASLHSRHLSEDNDFLQSADSADSSGHWPELAISWKTPWLYLVLLLLVWLLLF